MSSIRIFNVLIDAFRHFGEFVLIYLYEFIGLLNLGYLSHFKRNDNIICKQIAMRWLFFTKVNTVLLITVDLLVKKWTGTRKKEVTEILEKIKKRKRGVKAHLKREPLKGTYYAPFYKM